MRQTLRARFMHERRAFKNAQAALLTAQEWGSESRIRLATRQVEKRRMIYEKAKAEWEAAGRPMETGYEAK